MAEVTTGCYGDLGEEGHLTQSWEAGGYSGALVERIEASTAS